MGSGISGARSTERAPENDDHDGDDQDQDHDGDGDDNIDDDGEICDQ